ncbi:hypothetical protein GCM10023349_15140 [Nocardioides conyzicola]|uniref:Cbb3-type cytochrome c oxidase subunit 3 n=1 Tax=Nocardioides conyzicola TaxID=1651781 RepID=A0ABP8X2N3_9ACTN
MSELGYTVWFTFMALWTGAVLFFGMLVASRSEDRVIKLHPRETQSSAAKSTLTVASPEWVESHAHEFPFVEEQDAAPVAPATREARAAH